MKNKNLILFMMFAFLGLYAEQKKDWTWSYRKRFHVNEAHELADKSNLIFSKIQVPNFSQLIFSWNAFRPKKGYFTFSIQPRNSITKQWGNWYKMVDWGLNVQKSYCIEVKGDTSYVYVRLEMPPGKVADGFRLKIEPNDGADLTTLRLISVCISDFSKFKIEQPSQMLLQLPSIKIDGVPKYSQMVLKHEENKNMCSPTSMCMLVSYLLKREIDPVDFALQVYDKGLKIYGSWPFNTAHAFEKCPTCFFRAIRLNSFAELHSYLLRGIPIAISVRGKITGAPKDYNDGHLILVIGWDQKNRDVLVHDPAFEKDHKVVHKYEFVNFIRAWERSHRLAYVVEKR